MMAERWWTAPAEAPSGKTVIVTGHDYLDKIREKGKHPFRVEVTWDYEPQPDGMPSEADAQLMSRRQVDVKADYSCFEIENEFIVGYGLDYAQQYRTLPYIGVLKRSIYEK